MYNIKQPKLEFLQYLMKESKRKEKNKLVYLLHNKTSKKE